MVAKKDAQNETGASDIELAHSSDVVIPTDPDMDRWHSDVVDQFLFERTEIPVKYYEDDLRNIVSFEEHIASLSADEILSSSDVIGSGAMFLRGHRDMARLVNKKFLFAQWEFFKSQDYEGGWFAYAEVIDVDNNRYCFTDGTKFGVRDQLASVTARYRTKNNLIAEFGLDHREYDWPKNPEPGQEQITVHVNSIA